MVALLRMSRMTLGIPKDIVDRTGAYLVVVLEGRDRERLDIDIADVANQLTDADALDVYICLRVRAQICSRPGRTPFGWSRQRERMT